MTVDQLQIGEPPHVPGTAPEAPVSWTFHVMGQPVPWQRTGGKGTRRFTPKRTRDYERTVSEIALIRRPFGWPHQSKDVLFGMVVRVFHGDRRRRDNDNCVKAIKDALNGVAYVDDHQVQKTYVEWTLDRENPRAEVTLVRLGVGHG